MRLCADHQGDEAAAALRVALEAAAGVAADADADEAALGQGSWEATRGVPSGAVA